MNLTRFELKDLIFRTLKDIKRVSRGAGDIFYADVANVDISDVYNLLSEYRKRRTDTIKKETAKKLSAGAELLLIYALSELGYDFKLPLQYTDDENGKLYLTDFKGVYFNLSHSGTMVACVVCKNECGIDIESERKENPAIADKYFTDREKKLLSEKRYNFTQIWVRKEAVAKADGRGIKAGLKNIDTSGDTLSLSGLEYRLYDIQTDLNGYNMAVAIRQT